MIFVGQDMYVNVTGFPNTFYTINFDNAAENYTWNQWGRTDDNGTSSLHFQSDLDTNEGHYVVTLLVNNTAEASVALDINVDLVLWGRLKDEQHDAEIEALRQADQDVLAQVGQDLEMLERAFIVFLFAASIGLLFVMLFIYGFRREIADKLATQYEEGGGRIIKWVLKWMEPPDMHAEYGGGELLAPGDKAKIAIDCPAVPAHMSAILDKDHDQILKVIQDDIEGKGVVKPPTKAEREEMEELKRKIKGYEKHLAKLKALEAE
jgi:hypothetical protein